MGANFNFYATVTNVAESITNNIVNNYYAQVAAMAPSAKEQVLLPATEVCPVEEHNDSKASVAKVTSGRGRGARKKQMFKSQQEARRWADLFIQYLKSRHMAGTTIDCSGENFVTRALLSFLYEWKRHSIIDKNGICGPACARFLQDSCNLTFSVEQKAYEDQITRILTGKAKRPSTMDDVQDYVRQVMQH